MSTTVRLALRRLPHAQGLPLPSYHSAGAAGLDMAAALADDAPVQIAPGERALLPTGFALEIPPGHEGQVRPRSGLALKRGLTVLNAPGTIDADYRGEVMVLLINLGSEPQEIRRGDRIAQLVIQPVARAEVEQVDELAPAERGAGGFGSTG